MLEDACHVRFRRRGHYSFLEGLPKVSPSIAPSVALKHKGVEAGIVNAGGDLRTFGSSPQFLHLRHPCYWGRVAGAVRLRERAAMATSGIHLKRRKHSGHYVSPLLHGCTRQSAGEQISADCGRSELYDSRPTGPKLCSRCAKLSCASLGAVFCGCGVARARWRSLLEMSNYV